MAREDLHFRLRISASLLKRLQRAGALNGRSATAEIVARLEASFLIDGVDREDEELSAILADIDNLKRKFLARERNRKV